MNISIHCFLAVAVFVASLQFSSGWFRGRRRRRSNGRHNTNINHKGINYNYNGRKWNTNVNHNFGSSNVNLNANYGNRHKIGVRHNWKNRQTNFGYTYNFGKRGSIANDQQRQDHFLKIESNPVIFLEKLTLSVKQFVENHKSTVPALANLTVVSGSRGAISNVTVAKEVVCLVRKLQRMMPKSLGNFIIKMIKYHGLSYHINDLKDFFNVNPALEKGEDDIDAGGEGESCNISDVQVDEGQKKIDTDELFEIKKFVSSLIMVAMKYQQMLEG